MNDRHFANFHLAGFTYYDGVDVFHELKIGTHLSLVAEPENKFDPTAVAIYFHGKKLGYVPRDENKQIFQFLTLGHADVFEACINRISPESHPEKQVGVLVRIMEKKMN